jgi:hypothetical protein
LAFALSGTSSGCPRTTREAQSSPLGNGAPTGSVLKP